MQEPAFDTTKLTDGLNEEQKRAVETTEGPVIIIAGAGTGKTKTILTRIAYIIANKLASPSQILALTFTEKACAEMRERLDILLPYGDNDVELSTFHSFGETLIRENAITVGLDSDYRLMNKAEEIYFFREHLFSFPLDYYRPISNPTRFISDILSYFSKLKDEDISEELYRHYIEELQQSAADNKPGSFDSIETLREYISIQEELLATYSAYEKLKVKEASLNFPDLITLPLGILRTRSTIREYYQHKYKYILVDEYQDTNYSQNILVDILSRQHQNLCVCGDDDQAIYKFRGASISNIMQFKERYPGSKSIILTANYRSGQHILDSAYNLITHNNPDRLEVLHQIDKKLVARGAGKNIFPKAIITESLPDELLFLTTEIEHIKNEESLSYSDFAILIRSNAQAQPVIRELTANGIPYKYQGNTGLYETREVRPLLSFLYALARFDDNINYFHLAQSPLYHISMHALMTCNNLGRIHSKPLSYIFRNMGKYGEEASVASEDQEEVTTLISDIDIYGASSRDESIGSVLLAYIKEKQYMEYIGGDSDMHIENIQKFFQKIDKFIVNTNTTSIPHFCDYIDYTRALGDDPSADDLDPAYEGVNILTIHKAKGMEFHTVFMIDLVEGRFPSREMKDPIEVPPALIHEILLTGNSHREEERRLFYVGMTRAKERLYLLAAKNYFLVNLKKPSPFIAETGLDAARLQIPGKEDSQESAFPPTALPAPAPLILTQSKIEAYTTCPLQYHYSYMMNLKEEQNASADFGSIIHAIIREILIRDLQQNQIDEEEAVGMLAVKWKDEGYISEEHAAFSVEKAKQMIHTFFTMKAEMFPAFVEKPFNFIHSDTVSVNGRWDLIDVHERIIDFKTGHIKKREDAVKRAKDSMQLKIYALAYHNKFGRLPESVNLLFIESGILAGYKPGVKDIRLAEQTIDEVAGGIQKGDFEARPTFMACTYCPFNTICPYTLAG